MIQIMQGRVNKEEMRREIQRSISGEREMEHRFPGSGTSNRRKKTKLPVEGNRWYILRRGGQAWKLQSEALGEIT